MPNDDLERVAREICRERSCAFVGRVGEGTFKQTFHVVNPDNVSVALKLYKTTTFTLRDEREVRAMKRCKHANIARLLSVRKHSYKEREYVAITEEFLSGGTLTSRGQISASQCVAIGSQLVEAIAHIAGLGLVHRDIKPDNIMFRSDGLTPILTDFGVVRDLGDSSITPTWAARGPGTPFFAAPEQLNNEKDLIDWRTDQFALGIVMGCVVFGDHPYRDEGMSDGEVVERVSLRQGPASWFSVRARSAGLASLNRMAAPWPVQRFRKPEILRRQWQMQGG
jgi:serine/threonine protein kinase